MFRPSAITRLVSETARRILEIWCELFGGACPAVHDRSLGVRCGRERVAGRRCYRCLALRGKRAGPLQAHSRLWGGSLRDAFLEEARLAGGELRWNTFQGARLRAADLEGADLRDTDFSGADLSMASFRGADLTHARMRFLKALRGAAFEGAVLEDAVILPAGPTDGASFAFSDLTGARLADGDFRGVDFRSCRLAGADLRRARLAGADLSRADLSRADLSGADLTGAKTDGACLEGARSPGAARGGGSSEGAGLGDPKDLSRIVLGEVMRAFASVGASSAGTKLRVLARKAEKLRREDALDLVMPILEDEEAVNAFPEEAATALGAIGRDGAVRPFLMGLLAKGAGVVRREAATLLAAAPLGADVAALFRAMLRSPEEPAELKQGIFRAVAPNIEDEDPEAVRIARELLEAGELFGGELITALAQSGPRDAAYRGALEKVLFDRSLDGEVRLSAARDLVDRFFDGGIPSRLGELLEDRDEPLSLKRNVFWYAVKRVVAGEARALELAGRLLGKDPELDIDVRWALAEGGDAAQAPYFLDIARRAARGGWAELAVQGRGERAASPPYYDDVVRAAEALGKIGPPEATEPLSALVRRDEEEGAPPGSVVSLAEVAKEAVGALRAREAAAAPAGDTQLMQTAGREGVREAAGAERREEVEAQPAGAKVSRKPAPKKKTEARKRKRSAKKKKSRKKRS